MILAAEGKNNRDPVMANSLTLKNESSKREVQRCHGRGDPCNGMINPEHGFGPFSKAPCNYTKTDFLAGFKKMHIGLNIL
jgi:hypothetical protein